MSLRELTKEQHRMAERQDFVKILMSGIIHPDFYATYLFNQFVKYHLLETIGQANGCFDDMNAILRTPAIEKDFAELWTHDDPPVTVASTDEYVQYMKKHISNPHAIMAHTYVHHMGDLSGGQMIKSKIPGKGLFYKFDADKELLKDIVRSKIDNTMAEEAKVAFSFATKLFQDLTELNIEYYLEQPNTVSK